MCRFSEGESCAWFDSISLIYLAETFVSIIWQQQTEIETVVVIVKYGHDQTGHPAAARGKG